MRPTRRQRAVRKGLQGRDHGLHGRGRPLRGAEESRASDRDGAPLAGRERAPHTRPPRGAGPHPRGGGGMSVVTESRLIEPHGGTLVDRTGERPDDLESLETLTLSSRELSDLDMLASGALSPLQGFMGREDYESVLESMRLASGLPWALPVCLAVDEAPKADRVALADESGKPLAVLDVAGVYEYDREREAEQCFRTTEDAHPGVARLYGQK